MQVFALFRFKVRSEERADWELVGVFEDKAVAMRLVTDERSAVVEFELNKDYTARSAFAVCTLRDPGGVMTDNRLTEQDPQ